MLARFVGLTPDTLKRELSRTVGRYLADFERIITESDQRDPSGRLSHGQLVSDTGRVYLFLAHASGRLG